MPRKAYLAKHYSSEELKKKYLKSKDSVESRRWHLLWKISLGWTIKYSAIAVGISYNYAQEILREYNKSGAKALKNGHKNPQKRSRGKKPLLSKEQIEKLKQELESVPSPEDGIWTGPKVARWIEKETGREKVRNQRGWDYLKKCPKGLASRRNTPGRVRDRAIKKEIN